MIVTFKVDNLNKMNSELRAFAEFLRLNAIADEDVFASRLVSCELITNVIRHGGEAAEFTGELRADRIIVTVNAKSLQDLNTEVGAPDVFAESGRGLYIVKCFGEIETSDGGLRVCIKRH